MTDTLEILAKILREELEPCPRQADFLRAALMRVVVRLDMEVQQRHLDEVLEDEVVVQVDPDELLARRVVASMLNPIHLDVCPTTALRYQAYDYVLEAIKQARRLERQEAKPKLIWGNHDGTGRCPVDREAWVIVQYPSQFMIGRAGDRDWRRVSRYAEFDPDGAAFEGDI